MATIISNKGVIVLITLFQCPLCHDKLNNQLNLNNIDFSCSGCGFSSKVYNTKSVEKAYQQLITNQTSPSKNQEKLTKGFKIKKHKKETYEFDTSQLEDDNLILLNNKKAMEKIETQHLSNPLLSISQDNKFQLVYYEKFDQSLPPEGKYLQDIVSSQQILENFHHKGIVQLFKFQEIAFERIYNKENVIITAPTGIGKTEAFLLPILIQIIENKKNTSYQGPHAILVYPTKALTKDQEDKIKQYCYQLDITIQTYDGDTPAEIRKLFYDHPPDIILTNPDMIHYHLKNIKFQSLINRVKILVIDEIHLCIGSFGTNILWILRRIKRFSPEIQFVGASATISNANNFAISLFDKETTLISVDDARKSELHMLMIYPITMSNLSTIINITKNFVDNSIKCLVFGNGHRSAEVLNILLQDKDIKSNIHRAGLSVQHRKIVEKKFKSNQLEALVSTPTLELGMDIGDIDAVISMLTGITSFTQRIGRAGRKGQESYATLVFRGDDPISAYYARYPEEYFSDIPPAYVEENNPIIRNYQTKFMLLDMPLTKEEGIKYQDALSELFDKDELISNNRTIRLKNPDKTRKEISNYSIRGIGKSVSIWHLKKEIGKRNQPLAIRELHPGAIYLNAGKAYKVKKYSNITQTAEVSSILSKNQKTQALRYITPTIIEVFQENNINGIASAYCKLQLEETVTGYIKQNIFNNELIGTYNLEIPVTYTFQTVGFLISLPQPEDIISDVFDFEKENTLGGSFHAIEHVLIESANSITGGGANEIGGISMGDSGLIFVYDGAEGGSGLSKLLYNDLNKGLLRSLKIMNECPCKRIDGCPRCTYSYQCGNNNQPLNRLGAIEVLNKYGKENTELQYNFEGYPSYVIDPTYRPF